LERVVEAVRDGSVELGEEVAVASNVICTDE
jgi:hypothetical protein